MSEEQRTINDKRFTCIMCPLGCEVTVKADVSRNITEIIGNSCKKGEGYAREEFIAPKRMLTSTVAVVGHDMGRLPVRTSGYIPKDRIMDCMKEIEKIKVKGLVKTGDILLKNILGLGVDIIAMKDMY